MHKAVIFDLDGTLLNSLGDLAAASNYGLKKCGYPTHEVDEYKTFVGDGRYKLIERVLPEVERVSETIDKVLALFNEYYGEHMIDMTRPYEGIAQLLDELKVQGIKIAVVSNKPHEFTTEIVKKFFGDRFDIIFGQREGYKAKPDPSAVLEVIKEFGLSKEECVYVGDSNVDIKTAKNSGLKSVGVLWGFRSKEELEKEGADYIAVNVDELKNII